ncbi:MAG TPA: bifunctional oligoribonuclease/PAP phosphatase NrnA [Flavobacteriaceae bacterium]|nr:bifunctional oligoribonuclease/PAP phosphatase NrnA [Flavobacteriaceae bacterium]
MTKAEYKALNLLLDTPKKIVIVPHHNPDGDAIGSSLGLFHYLKKRNHQVSVVAPNDYPAFLKWLPGTPEVLVYESQAETCADVLAEASLLFALDFNALHRTGVMQSALEQAEATFVLIDHHPQPEAFAQFTYSDVGMSSTCEMIYHFITHLGGLSLLDEATATCLYTGIMTDTGSFKYPSTTSLTHRVVAHLLDCGANHSAIHEAVYDANRTSRLQLLGCALKNLTVLPEYRTAYLSLSQEELKAHDFKKGDTEGFVNYGLSIKDVVFAAIFIENAQEDVIKISLRSKGSFSVNAFSRAHFDGGGHTNAAGGKSDLSLPDTIEKFISILPTYKNALNK